MSVTDKAHRIGRQRQRKLRFETVTLMDGETISAEIPSAIVAIDDPIVDRDDGPATYDGTINVPGSFHEAAIGAKTATVRGNTWDILTVSDVASDNFTIQISRIDEHHSNLFDLKQEQAGWHGT